MVELNSYHPHVRYFAVQPEQFKNHKIIIIPDNDNLPLDFSPNGLYCATLNDGRLVISVLFTTVSLQAIYIDTGQIELNQIVLDTYDINNSFIGRTYSDVLDKFPELKVPIESIDDDGNIIKIPRLQMKT